MKSKTVSTGIIALLLGMAGAAQADVLLDFSGGSATATSFAYVFNMGATPVTMTPGTASSGALDGTRNTLTDGGAGTLTLTAVGYNNGFNTTDFTGTQVDMWAGGNGLFVKGDSGNKGLRKGQAVVFTVSIDSTLQAYLDNNGYSLRLTEFSTGDMEGGSLDLFTVGSSSLGSITSPSTSLSVNTTLTDGMQFAVQKISNNNNDGTLASIALNVIPEPATLGMITASGIGILFIRRRIMM